MWLDSRQTTSTSSTSAAPTKISTDSDTRTQPAIGEVSSGTTTLAGSRAHSSTVSLLTYPSSPSLQRTSSLDSPLQVTELPP